VTDQNSAAATGSCIGQVSIAVDRFGLPNRPRAVAVTTLMPPRGRVAMWTLIPVSETSPVALDHGFQGGPYVLTERLVLGALVAAALLGLARPRSLPRRTFRSASSSERPLTR
jgi:hypothetical protein